MLKQYKVYEKLQKEKNDTLRKTEQKYRKDEGQNCLCFHCLGMISLQKNNKKNSDP